MFTEPKTLLLYYYYVHVRIYHNIGLISNKDYIINYVHNIICNSIVPNVLNINTCMYNNYEVHTPVNSSIVGLRHAMLIHTIIMHTSPRK